MNSRLDWLVLSDYYSIYVTNAPPKRRISRAFNRSAFSMPKNRCLYSQAPAKVP